MNDLEVRDLFAMFAMCGIISKEGYAVKRTNLAKVAYVLADAMLEVREIERPYEEEPEEGIAAIKKGQVK